MVELVAVPTAFLTWKSRLRGKKAILFTDNSACQSALIRGYTAQEDAAEVVNLTWITLSQLRCSCWFDRVDSESNIADGPSRNNFKFMDNLNAKKVDPHIDWCSWASTASSPTTSEAHRDWAWEVQKLLAYLQD